MTGSTTTLGNQEGLAGMKGVEKPVEDVPRKVMRWATVKVDTKNLEFYSNGDLLKGLRGSGTTKS